MTDTSLTNVTDYGSHISIVAEDGYSNIARTLWTDVTKLDMRQRFRGNAPIRGSNRDAEVNTRDEELRTL